MAWILLRFERFAAFETRKGVLGCMLHQNSVFHSLLKHVPWNKFGQIIEKHGADKSTRRLDTKRHFIALLYGQFSGAMGLRETVSGMESHETRLYHLGAVPVKRSTMSDANRSDRGKCSASCSRGCLRKRIAGCDGRPETQSCSFIPRV